MRLVPGLVVLLLTIGLVWHVVKSSSSNNTLLGGPVKSRMLVGYDVGVNELVSNLDEFQLHNKWLLAPNRAAEMMRGVQDVLEVGSFEGCSMVTWAALGAKTITCVDTWEGSVEHKGWNFQEIEERWRHNADVLTARGVVVEQVKGSSFDELPRLGNEGRMFDMVYIDGSHTSYHVMMDAVHALRVLRPGGLLVFDDYQWKFDKKLLNAPGQAIDMFRLLYAPFVETLYEGWQCWTRYNGKVLETFSV